MLLIGCEQCGTTLITFEVIEPAKVTAGAVHEKTEHLDKMVCDRDSLFIFRMEPNLRSMIGLS